MVRTSCGCVEKHEKSYVTYTIRPSQLVILVALDREITEPETVSKTQNLIITSDLMVLHV